MTWTGIQNEWGLNMDRADAEALANEHVDRRIEPIESLEKKRASNDMLSS
jgi:hypothetical protein